MALGVAKVADVHVATRKLAQLSPIAVIHLMVVVVSVISKRCTMTLFMVVMLVVSVVIRVLVMVMTMMMTMVMAMTVTMMMIPSSSRSRSSIQLGLLWHCEHGIAGHAGFCAANAPMLSWLHAKAGALGGRAELSGTPWGTRCQ